MYSHLSKPCIMITNLGVRRLHVQPVPTAIHHVHKDWGANLLTTAGFKQVSMSSCIAQFKSIQTATCLSFCVCVVVVFLCVCAFVCVCVCVCFSSFLPGTSLWGFYSYSMHPSNNNTFAHWFNLFAGLYSCHIHRTWGYSITTNAQGYYEIQKFHADS